LNNRRDPSSNGFTANANNNVLGIFINYSTYIKIYYQKYELYGLGLPEGGGSKIDTQIAIEQVKKRFDSSTKLYFEKLKNQLNLIKKFTSYFNQNLLAMKNNEKEGCSIANHECMNKGFNKKFFIFYISRFILHKIN